MLRFRDMAKEELPIRCECGWVFPAAFRVTSSTIERTQAELEPGTNLLFACGNCGVWRPIALGRGWAAKTANAAGFGNMPSDERCAR